jgi:hypothetical protein
MRKEPQGSWLQAAVTTECPGCGHIVDANEVICEWCDAPLNGELRTAQDDTPPAPATDAVVPPARPPIQPALTTYLLAQPLRPAEPIGPLPQAVITPDQPGAASIPSIQMDVSPAPTTLAVVVAPLPLDQSAQRVSPPGLAPVAPVSPGVPGTPAAPIVPAAPVSPGASGAPGVPGVPAAPRPSQVTGIPAYDVPSPVRAGYSAVPRLQSLDPVQPASSIASTGPTGPAVPGSSAAITGPTLPGSSSVTTLPTLPGSSVTQPMTPSQLTVFLSRNQFSAPPPPTQPTRTTQVGTSVDGPGATTPTGSTLDGTPVAALPVSVQMLTPILPGQIAKQLTQLADLLPVPAPLLLKPTSQVLQGPQTSTGPQAPQAPQGPQGPQGPQATSASPAPVVRRGIVYGIAPRPLIWPTSSTGRVSGPGG